MPLINGKLDLLWSRYCVITEISSSYEAISKTNPVRYQVTSKATGATFQMNNAKIYVPVVTLSINDNIKFLEQI